MFLKHTVRCPRWASCREKAPELPKELLRRSATCMWGSRDLAALPAPWRSLCTAELPAANTPLFRWWLRKGLWRPCHKECLHLLKWELCSMRWLGALWFAQMVLGAEGKCQPSVTSAAPGCTWGPTGSAGMCTHPEQPVGDHMKQFSNFYPQIGHLQVPDAWPQRVPLHCQWSLKWHSRH